MDGYRYRQMISDSRGLLQQLRSCNSLVPFSFRKSPKFFNCLAPNLTISRLTSIDHTTLSTHHAECTPFHNTMTRGSPATTTTMAATGESPVVRADDSHLPPLSEWVSSKNSSTKLQEEERRLFRQRLLTFSPWTYFAKPSSLSPIVCARFG
jgi:hypothetical protein